MALGVHIERIALDLFDLGRLDPGDGAIAAFLEMREDSLPLLRCKFGAKLIIYEWQFTPEAEIRLVIVFDVSGAHDRTALPVRSKVPGAGLEQDLFGLCEVLLLAGD